MRVRAQQTRALADTHGARGSHINPAQCKDPEVDEARADMRESHQDLSRVLRFQGLVRESFYVVKAHTWLGSFSPSRRRRR